MKSKYVYVVGVYPPNHPTKAGESDSMCIKRTDAIRDGVQFWETREACERWLIDDIRQRLYDRFPAGTKEGDFIRRIEAVSAAAIGFAKAIEKLEIWGEPVRVFKSADLVKRVGAQQD